MIGKVDPHELLVISDAEFRAELERQCAAEGGQSAWARKRGIARTHVCDTLAQRREVGDVIIIGLGYQPVRRYFLRKGGARG